MGTGGGGGLDDVACVPFEYVGFVFLNCTCDNSWEIVSTEAAGAELVLLLGDVVPLADKLSGFGLTGGGAGGLESARRPRGVGSLEFGSRLLNDDSLSADGVGFGLGGGGNNEMSTIPGFGGICGGIFECADDGIEP